MTVYIIAQLKFTRRELYSRYAAAFPAVFKKFKGALIAADENIEILEGQWDRDKVVMLSFPDEASALEFHSSPEYQAIAADRKAGTDGIVLLVQGRTPV